MQNFEFCGQRKCGDNIMEERWWRNQSEEVIQWSRNVNKSSEEKLSNFVEKWKMRGNFVTRHREKEI